MIYRLSGSVGGSESARKSERRALLAHLLRNFVSSHTCILLTSLLSSQAEISSEQVTNLLEATGNTEVEAFYPIIFANYLSDPAKVAELIASPGGSGGGGGGGGGGAGGGGDAAEEEEKEEEVEEEADIGGMYSRVLCESRSCSIDVHSLGSFLVI